MEKNKYNGGHRGDAFLVLVPHRDTRVLVKKYGDTLIGAGLTGVYTFPRVIPLAVLSRPLSDEELKECARSLRQIMGADKFFTDEISSTELRAGAEDMMLFGHSLNLDVTNMDFGEASLKIKSTFSPLVIGTFLLPVRRSQSAQDFDDPITRLNASISPCEKLGFRAAAVANMFWRPFKTCNQKGFKWKIGKLFWLPRPEKKLTERLIDTA